MKTLIFFRHAKAEPGGGSRDIERRLADRGRRAAELMGRFLGRTDQVPEAALTSPATRAVETLELAREAGRLGLSVREARSLYESSPEQVLEVVREEDDRWSALLLVGHEPVWSETLSRLTGGGRIRFPTGAMARVDVGAPSWEGVRFGAGQLIWLVSPKLFSSGDFGPVE